MSALIQSHSEFNLAKSPDKREIGWSFTYASPPPQFEGGIVPLDAHPPLATPYQVLIISSVGWLMGGRWYSTCITNVQTFIIFVVINQLELETMLTNNHKMLYVGILQNQNLLHISIY